jgi:hypothetical protein
LDCKYFIPDKEQLPYFEDLALAWNSKAEKFKEFPMIKSDALQNAGLFIRIVKKIKSEGGKVNE